VGCNTGATVKSGYDTIPKDNALVTRYNSLPSFDSVCSELIGLVDVKTYTHEWHHQFFEEGSHGYAPGWSEKRDDYIIIAWSVCNDWDQGVWYVDRGMHNGPTSQNWDSWIKKNLFIGKNSIEIKVGRTPFKGYRLSIKVWW
jgi:hypothetical protein